MTELTYLIRTYLYLGPEIHLNTEFFINTQFCFDSPGLHYPAQHPTFDLRKEKRYLFLAKRNDCHLQNIILILVN